MQVSEMQTVQASDFGTKLNMAMAEIERLRREHGSAKAALRLAVEDDSDLYDFNALKSNVARFARELEAAEAEVGELEREREREARAEAEAEFPEALKRCSQLRAAFLTHRREACIALGRYFPALARCYGLSNKLAHEMLGPLPQHLNACRALELADAPQQSLADLKPDMDQHWKTVYELRPMYATHNSPTGDQSHATTI
jgi:hypothetical protein